MGDIWVVAELVAGRLSPVGLQLLGKARGLVDQDNGHSGQVVAVIMGHQVKSLAQELIAYGADQVLVIEDEQLGSYRTLPYTRVLVDLALQKQPDIILLGATSQGRDLAPRVAARLKTGLTADCLELSINEQRLLVQTKPSYGDNVMVDIVIPTSKPQMATVRPNVFPVPEKDTNRKGRMTLVPVKLKPGDLATIVKEIIPDQQEVSKLEEAEVIICGGRGMGSKENFDRLYELAEALDGSVAATRPPVDENWIDASFQIGQSGKMVAPKLLITCGVSGAVQFTVGMEKAKIVVAIDKDASAPIFNFATYGIVGDVREIIPALLKEIDAAKAPRYTP
ncbi:MAG: electron transfer flavoprotein subunit alpha/FixB family protein [bacterium]|jgi:electron transfer flavoprotein alpha subunit